MIERIMTVALASGGEMVIDLEKVSAVVYKTEGNPDHVRIDGVFFLVSREVANEIENAWTGYWGTRL